MSSALWGVGTSDDGMMAVWVSMVPELCWTTTAAAPMEFPSAVVWQAPSTHIRIM